jgi:hypothetical protein
MHVDDFVRAFEVQDELMDMHVDYAHTIAMGYHRERYYLVIVIGRVDFLWASPTGTKNNPESLLEDFLRVTRIKIRRIRMDDAGELSRSATFKAWCDNRGINRCPTPGYQHTMQARAEGAVRICKEHVRCLLKHAGMPYRFWPYALAQFCRIYNYWPCKGHAPPWELLTDTDFNHNLRRDIQTFGCYVIGQLPREHPLVKDTTHSDRGLEGAFLGWDLLTPTCWIYSFRLQKPVRMSDPTFFNRKFPFLTPEILANRHDISPAEIALMHEEDKTEEGLQEDDGDEYSTQPTQPAPSRKPTQPAPVPAPAPIPAPVPAPVPAPALSPAHQDRQ